MSNQDAKRSRDPETVEIADTPQLKKLRFLLPAVLVLVGGAHLTMRPDWMTVLILAVCAAFLLGIYIYLRKLVTGPARVLSPEEVEKYETEREELFRDYRNRNLLWNGGVLAVAILYGVAKAMGWL